LGARILFHFFVILLPENLVVSDLFCTFAMHLKMHCECGLRLSKTRASSALRSPCTTLAPAIEKSSGDDELGQLRRLTAADRTAKTAN
jgi:hypothetical protein